MAWSIVGVGTVVEVTATTHTLTEPAGCTTGDLLVACIASRIGSTTAITLPAGWTRATDQRINNVVAGTTGQASACVAYIIRGASPPALAFTHPTTPNVARGQIVAYRENTPGGGIGLDTFVANATATAITAISTTSITTTAANALLVGMVAGGSAATYTAFKTANAPSTASGATNTSSTPSTTTWTERADASSATGADIGLAVFDAVKTATGAAGTITATASVSSGHSVVMAAFGAAVATADAWNVNDKTNITLSASDKTATSTAAGGVRSTTKHTNGTAGKYYAEFLLGSSLPTVGIIETSASMTLNTAAFLMTNIGGIFINGGNPSTGAMDIGTPVVNDVVCVAWDAGAERVWFRLNGGVWNTSGTADPATGTEGIDASFATATPHALWIRATGGGQSATIRTELAEFTQTVPSGFNSWMDEASGPTAYTLPAVAGSYALAGVATSLEKSRFITAVAGSYALTGTDATLSKAAGVVHRTLPADPGAYALTGATAGLYRGREVLAVAGSYGLSGTAASLEVGREVAAVAGSYALTGTAASLELGKEVLAVAGSYVVTGAATTLRHGWKIAADGSSYALTGAVATLTKGAAIVHRTLPADAGAYALTGAATSLELGREVLATGGSHALTGATTSLEVGREALATAGSYALSGAVAQFRRTWAAVAGGGSYALTGTPANLLQPNAFAIIGLPGSHALSGADAGLELGREVVAAVGSHALGGVTTSLELGREILAIAGAYALTGTATSFKRDSRVLADAGAYALTGPDVVLDLLPAPEPTWSFVSTAITPAVTTATLTMVEPADVIEGDLLVACVASRSTATTPPTIPAGWTEVNAGQSNNNIITGSGSIPSGHMSYIVRGASPPDLTWTMAAGINVAKGQIVAYRGNAAAALLDANSAVTTATGITALNVAGITTATDDDLVVAMVVGGRITTWSGFNATSPGTASGTTDQTNPPSLTDWKERLDVSTSSGADVSLAIFDAVKETAGATGNFTATAVVSAAHVVITAAFKIARTTAKSITAQVASYALTGQLVSLLKSNVYAVAASGGSHLLTGTAASLEHGREVLAIAGSHVLTGTASSLERGLEVLASNGSYAVSGATATFIRARRVVAAGGSYSLSGLPANLLTVGARAIIGLPGAYALTGQPITLTMGIVPPVTEWLPDSISGLTVWLDASQLDLADGAAVSPWPDLSGGGRHGAVVGTPAPVIRTNALNSLPVVRFKPNEGRIRGDNGLTTAPYGFNFSILYVARMVGPTVGRILAGAYPEYTNFLVGYHSSGTNVVYDNAWIGSPAGYPGGLPQPWKLWTYAASHDGANYDSDFHINGTASGGLAGGTGFGLRYHLSGYSQDGTEETCDGEVAELLIYDNKLAEADRQAVEGYLAWKWGIEAELAVDHPYHDAPPAPPYIPPVTPPGTPYWGPSGGHIPKKQLRKAVRELLKRQRKAEKPIRPREVAAELLAAIAPGGLGVRERRQLISLIAEGLRLELPSLFYSQPIIHDREPLMRAILYVMQLAIDRIAAEEEEDEEAALLLLSA